jgi:predicted nucleotidyltransferase
MSEAIQVSPEALAAYRATAIRRWQDRQAARALRREQAWQVARHAAQLLRERFGASRVVAYGSLAHGLWFSETSDIDLAAWGLPPDDYFLAVATLQELSPEFEIDLVNAGQCQPALREAIAEEGVGL